MAHQTKQYHAEIVAGSLLTNESRKIAALLLAGLDEKTLYEQVTVNNILQKRSPASAKRQAKLIRNRLSPLAPAVWTMVSEGSHEQATQALLVAAIMHSRIVGDFIRQVIADKVKTYQKYVSFSDWNRFLEECRLRDPSDLPWKNWSRPNVRGTETAGGFPWARRSTLLSRSSAS
jgi:hypothetical protein